MEIIIKANPKEIAELLVEVEAQLEKLFSYPKTYWAAWLFWILPRYSS